eukprot:TRINITY_DN734_c0_g1_i21.p1 TRINITY_DN734_c0_g1~~TRINITY_DN734_c0_g1_i21.p1  ORF type:complete len:150 (-),score=37.33 TRINITY_DN734_c0_g1_i21:66-515(-)
MASFPLLATMQSYLTGDALSQGAWNAFSLLLVGLFWGGTNPMIKYGTKGVEDIKHDNAIIQFLKKVFYLGTRWQYMVPFLLNLSGSVVYYYTLGKARLSLAVPLVNSATFIVTAIVSTLFGERIEGGKTAYLGIVFVVIGITLCVISAQ